MARQPRWVIPGIPQHIVQRGNNKGSTFFDNNDYNFYRTCLRKYAEESGCRVHAYVLMTNHVHIVVTPDGRHSLSQLMQRVGTRYVGYINDRYERTGSLWEGRYYASLVETERYLLTCYRYVELNPVRAGMVEDPADYLWSSYRHNALGQDDDLVSRHTVYSELGADPDQQQKAYRTLFAKNIDRTSLETIRAAARGGWVLGGRNFADEVARKSGRSALPRPRGGDRKSARFKGV